MSLPVLCMVVAAAFLHAGWNFLAKTIPGGAAFVWLIAVVMSVLLLPFSAAYLWFYPFDWSLANAGILLLTSFLHLAYFVTLQRGYEKADLSVVYPLSRGTGPVFASLGAVLFLGEQLGLSGISGLLMVVSGVLLIAGVGRNGGDPARRALGVQYGLGIGLLIACYTVWDGYAVKTLLIPPVLLEYASHPFRVLALTPVARRRKAEIRSIWQNHAWKIVAISLVSPIAFIMVLYAMKQAPVHQVAPMREMSIVFGVIFGGRLLAEEQFWLRLTGSGFILAGIFLLLW